MKRTFVFLAILVPLPACHLSYDYTDVEIVTDEWAGNVEGIVSGETIECEVTGSYFQRLLPEEHLRFRARCGAEHTLLVTTLVAVGLGSGSDSVPVEFMWKKDRGQPVWLEQAVTLSKTVFEVEADFNGDRDTAEYGPVEAITFEGSLAFTLEQDDFSLSGELSLSRKERLFQNTSRYD